MRSNSIFKHTINLTLISSVLVLLGGCFASTDKIDSDRVQSADVHQSYDLYHDANTNTTHFYATFRVGGSTGTTVELVQPGKLEINGQDAVIDNTYGAHYSSKLRTGNQQTFTVTWSTNEGGKYINTFNVLPVSPAASFNNSISLHAPTIINIDAPNFDRKEETVRLEIHQVGLNGNNNYVSISNYDSITKQIIVKPEDLINLQNGPATFVLSRSSFRTLEQKTAVGGNAYLKYNKDFSGQIDP